MITGDTGEDKRGIKEPRALAKLKNLIHKDG